MGKAYIKLLGGYMDGGFYEVEDGEIPPENFICENKGAYTHRYALTKQFGTETLYYRHLGIVEPKKPTKRKRKDSS